MSNLLPYRKEKKYLPHELLQMYRRRAGLTQTELAALIGLQSRRMMPAWEAGESLPKPDRLEKLIEVYLNRGVFIIEHEVDEARQLWITIKNFYDANSERLASYPVFDDAWFEKILITYRLYSQHQSVTPSSVEKSSSTIVTSPISSISTIQVLQEENIADLPSSDPAFEETVSRVEKLKVVPLLQTSSFIGREREVTEVCNLLRQPNSYLITLTGPGGTGKTRLAVQVALEMSPLFEDGVRIIRLEAARDRHAVVSAIAQVLGVKEAKTKTPAPDILWLSLIEYLQYRNCLLVLDNFEQVMEAAPLVMELLSVANRIKIIVTSREILHLYNEQEYPVPPLDLPPVSLRNDTREPSRLAQLSKYASVQLFVERARLVQPDFSLTDLNAQVVADICLKLDGLPLALELAAGRLKLFPPQTLLDRLNASGTSGSVLSGGPRDLPDRQQTLRNTLSWSYDLLEPAEQRLFCWLSVFEGGSSLQAIETVYNQGNETDTEILDLIASLVDKSLLRQVQTHEMVNEVRFKMLETVREYALERLNKSNEAEDAHLQHALFYLELVRQAEPLMRGGEQVEWLARFEMEHDNLRAALNWSLNSSAKEIVIGLQLAGALWQFWSTHGHISEGRAHLTKALSQARKANLESTADFARALNGVGHLARLQGDYNWARLCYNESLEIFRKLDDSVGVAASLNNLGISTTQQGEYSAALTYYQQSLELRRKLDDKGGISRCLNNLGVVATQQGDFEAATLYYQESLDLDREQGNKIGIAICLNNLGEVAMHQLAYSKAYAFVREALTINEEMDDKNSIAGSYKLLGDIEVCLGDESLAEDYLQKSLVLYRDLGNKQGIADVLESSSVISLRQNDFDLAKTHLEKAVQLLRELGDKRTLAYCLCGFASVAAAQGHYTRAVQLFSTSESLLLSIGAPTPPFDRPDYKRYRELVRANLTETEFAEAWGVGLGLSELTNNLPG